METDYANSCLKENRATFNSPPNHEHREYLKKEGGRASGGEMRLACTPRNVLKTIFLVMILCEIIFSKYTPVL